MFLPALLYFANITSAVKSGNYDVCISICLPFLLLPLFSFLLKKCRNIFRFLLPFSVASLTYRVLKVALYVSDASGAKTALFAAVVFTVFACILSENENARFCASPTFFLCAGIAFYALIAGSSSPVCLNGGFCIYDGIFGAVMSVSAVGVSFCFEKDTKKIFRGTVLGFLFSAPFLIINGGISLGACVFISNAFACAFEFCLLRKVIFSLVDE